MRDKLQVHNRGAIDGVQEPRGAGFTCEGLLERNHVNLFHIGCSFSSLTVGSFLLRVELFYLQLTILASLLKVGAFSLTVGAFLLTVGKYV